MKRLDDYQLKEFKCVCSDVVGVPTPGILKNGIHTAEEVEPAHLRLMQVIKRQRDVMMFGEAAHKKGEMITLYMKDKRKGPARG